ncbi:diacylglycerol/lipid kinase family protein [Treponema sp.]|uniref:diacylglycerol/lipid kinase family protein n=1 Tax=Treponema sp. TaxID=166 RepID=UPI003F127711
MLHFIVNPVSRSGKGLRLWKRKIEPVLISKEIPYTVEFSQEHGDVTRICAKISSMNTANEKCTIVIIGGDGTLNDAVQGISDFDSTTVAYIPTGSSNDFARDMKISGSAKKCLKKILSDSAPVELDLGEVISNGKSRKFVVSCGLGFDAAVCQKSSHSFIKKNLNKVGLGKCTYLAIALQQLIHAPKSDCTAEFDDGRKIEFPKFLFATSMIHRYEGGGFKFCPKANPTDGKINLCIANNKTLPGILFALPTAFLGLHGIFSGVTITEFSSATFRTTIPLWMHTDGEVYQKASEITVRAFEKKLKMKGI